MLLLGATKADYFFVPHEQQIGRHLHKDLSLDEKTMPHVYVIVSRIYGRLFLYLMNSKSDATYTRTYHLMRKQCLMFMLLLAASERAEINPLINKVSKRYCRVVQTYCLGGAPNNFQVAECQSFVD